MYNEISRNKLITNLIITGFVIFIMFLAFIYGYYYESGLLGLVVGIVFAVPSSLIGYYYSDKMVLSMAGAKLIEKKDNRELYNVVENLAITAGLPTPKIYIVEDPAMNAFATGRNPEHAVVAVTSGLLKNLTRTELEGVIAHELSHIKNFDTRLSVVVTIFVGLIVIMAQWFLRLGGLFGGGGSKKGGNWIFAIFGLLVILFSPLVAQLIQLALSRNREYLADADAALLTRYPQGLIGSLEKLSQQKNKLKHSSSVMNHMYITDPLKNLGSKKSFWGDWFSTHPPVEERIKRLKNMI